MAKGQKRSNRETKKPKQVKPKFATPATPGTTDQVKDKIARGKSK